jgi:hypothetical protein
LKRKLAANRVSAALFDSAAYVADIEAAYLHMWEMWAEGKPTAPFALTSVRAPPRP